MLGVAASAAAAADNDYVAGGVIVLSRWGHGHDQFRYLVVPSRGLFGEGCHRACEVLPLLPHLCGVGWDRVGWGGRW